MQVVLASNNLGKLAEFNELLAGLGIEMISQAEFNVPEAEETGSTYLENAMIKAKQAAQYTNLPVLADDSGLSVAALSGAPGVYSARYAGVKATDQANIEKLLNSLANEKNRAASFHCCLVLLNWPEVAEPITVEGVWPGEILKAPQGENGFGYDPVFYVLEKQCSSAQLSEAEKNAISHRARAMQLLMQAISQQKRAN
jgi:XTP/dITP diphosphohydrolase